MEYVSVTDDYPQTLVRHIPRIYAKKAFPGANLSHLHMPSRTFQTGRKALRFPKPQTQLLHKEEELRRRIIARKGCVV